MNVIAASSDGEFVLLKGNTFFKGECLLSLKPSYVFSSAVFEDVGGMMIRK